MHGGDGPGRPAAAEGAGAAAKRAGNRRRGGREWAGVRTSVAITMLICGTALVIMPQIHSAVLGANRLYAAAIASHRPRGGAGLPDVPAPRWMAPVSAGLGGVLVVAAGIGAAAGARRGDRDEAVN